MFIKLLYIVDSCESVNKNIIFIDAIKRNDREEMAEH